MGFGLTAYIPFVAYCIIIGTIFLTLFHNPRIGVYMITLLIPMQNLLIKLIIYPHGKDMMDFLFVSVAIGLFIHRKDMLPLKKYNANFVIFLLIPATYTSLWVGSFRLGFDLPISLDSAQVIQWKNFIMMPILYFMVLKTVNTKKEMLFLLLIMAFTLIILDLRFYNDVKWVSHEHFSWDKRADGTTFGLLGPNEIAAFYAVTAMFFIGLGLCEKILYRKALYLGAACFNFYTIMFLYSRGAYAGVLAGILFLGLIKSRLLLILLVVFFVSWHTILPHGVVERVEMTDSGGKLDGSSFDRIELWLQAAKEIKVNPITGVGVGGTHALGFKTSDGKSRNDVHNGYIEVLLEQGLLGVSILIGMLYYAFKTGWVLFRKSKDDLFKGLGLGLMGMVVVTMVVNMFGDRWTYFSTMGYFWIIYAMVVKLYQLETLGAKAMADDKAGDKAGNKAVKPGAISLVKPSQSPYIKIRP